MNEVLANSRTEQRLQIAIDTTQFGDVWMELRTDHGKQPSIRVNIAEAKYGRHLSMVPADEAITISSGTVTPQFTNDLKVLELVLTVAQMAIQQHLDNEVVFQMIWDTLSSHTQGDWVRLK